MQVYLGVDIGTTLVKAVAYDETGLLLLNVSIAYPTRYPQSGYAEQDPVEIANAVVQSINQLAAQLHPATVRFVSFGTAMHSLIAMDEKGATLTPCIIWADNRAAAISAQLRKSEEGQRIYQATGVPVHPMSPLCKLLWLKERQPALFRAAHKFIGIKEFVFYNLFGEYIIDTAIASATGLLNKASLQWDDEVLKLVGISHQKLAKLVAVEEVFRYRKNSSALLLNLPDGTPFIIGGADGSLASIAAGAISHLSATVGTSAAVRRLSDEPFTPADMSTFCYHAAGNRYITGGASNNGAVVLQWLKETFLQTSETYPELFKQAATVEAGSNGLLFLPYLLGERAPVWDAAAQGLFFGLTIKHTKAHLIRAVMEGVVYNLYGIAKHLVNQQSAEGIYATGGFTQSSLWLQITADVFKRKVLVPESPESSAFGAVMVGARAMGLPPLNPPVIIAEYHPTAEAHEVYKKRIEKFERLYQLIKNEFTGAEN